MGYFSLRRTVLLAAALAATAAPAQAASGTLVVPRGQPLQIAFANDLTGYGSAFSGSLSRAVRMAAAAHPTVRNFRLRINTFDAPCGDPDADVATAQAIVGNPQNAGVIGQLCSQGFDQALAVYQAAGVVTISGSATSPGLATLGYSVFNRTAVDDNGFDAWYATVATLPSELRWQYSYDLLFGEAPLQFADLYYDAASVLVRSLRRVARVDRASGALVIDRAALAADVRSTRHYEGVSCTITLERETGNRVDDPAALRRCAEDESDWDEAGRFADRR